MKTLHQSDDWFNLFQKGKEKAFLEVFARYYRPVTYFAMQILREDPYAEDIVSETFRKAWEERTKFASPSHLKNFLYLVTRNSCISYLRAGKLAQSTEQEWTRLTNEEQSTDSPLDLERVQTRLIQAIYQKLEQLPGGDILRMSFIEGKSTKEIALALNTTESNVYVIKSRSLKALRAMLTGNEWMLFVLILFKW
jgi:RNA polymerase sigma factor (sigma-70 family)